jgi:hypothetical protein
MTSVLSHSSLKEGEEEKNSIQLIWDHKREGREVIKIEFHW